MDRHLLLFIITIFLLASTVNTLRMHLPSSTVTYDSLKSSVTSPIDYKYYDNLNAPSANYYYGTITKEAYEMAVKLYKLDDYEQCGGVTPYATKTMQSCMSCPKERPLFNLGTRECEQCRAHITTQCDAMFSAATPTQASTGSVTNINATNGSSSTPTTNKVNNTTSPGTSSNISTPTTPSTTTTTTNTTTSTTTSSINDSFIVEWKPKPKVEQKPKPVPNNVITETTTSPAVDVFTPVPEVPNDSALHENYTISYRVVSNQTNASSAQSNQTNATLIAQSTGRQNITFSSQECPILTPYFNPSTKNCENCNQNSQYIPSQKKCLPIVWVSNPKSKYVILNQTDQLLKANFNVQKANPERTVRVCPIDRPLAVNGSCMACEADKIFNFTSQDCQAGCPDGFVFSQENSKCITAIFLTNSEAPNLLSPLRDFEQFRTGQKQRVKSSATIVQCPLVKPYSIQGVCSNCPDSYPFFNIESQECEACTRNRSYNTFTRKCDSSMSSGLEIKRIVPNIF